MLVETEGLSAASDQALQQLAERRGSEYGAIIGNIVEANLEDGRVKRFLESGTVESVNVYVRRVATQYDASHEYVHKLQNEENEVAWEALLEKLQRWAYPLLHHRSFTAERHKHCADCATDAAAVIATRRFPFDTSFLSWARVVLRNTCFNYIHSRCLQKLVPDTAMVEFDQKEEWLLSVPDPRSEDAVWRFEFRQTLVQALVHLTTAQAEFITLYYFSDMSYEELSSRLEKSRNTLYKLHHDALKKLREHWG